MTKRQLNVEVALVDLFTNPSIRQFARWLQKRNGPATELYPEKILPIGNRSHAPLTFAQQRLWFIDTMQGGSHAYNISRALVLKGLVDISVLQRVFTTLITRHAIFRTVYQTENEQAVQVIQDVHAVDFHIEHVDLTHLAVAQCKREIAQHIEQHQQYIFDLKTDVMLKVSFLTCSPVQGVLLVNIPHIATDGWSMDILTHECFTLYEAYIKKQANPLPVLTLQYADYAQWQNKYLTSNALDAHWQYWQQHLAGAPKVHSLPLDYNRPTDKNYVGAKVSEQLTMDISQSLLLLVQHFELTPFMLSHALLALVLSRHSGSHDIVLGMPIANRQQTELDAVVGLFVNTLVLRIDTDHDDLANYLAHVKAVHLEAQQHQDMPFEKLVDRLDVERTAAHTPLFQILLATQNNFSTTPIPQSSTLEIEKIANEAITAKFDLDVNISMHQQGVDIDWTYDTAIFNRERIEYFNQHLCQLLYTLANCAVTQPISLNELQMLNSQERGAQLRFATGDTKQYPLECGLHTLFEQRVDQDPNAVAIQTSGTQLTYLELNTRANALAAFLQEQHHISTGQTIAVCLERSETLLIAVLAILKTGGAYLTIDPSYPDPRITHILTDSGTALLLTENQYQSRLSHFGGTQICLDSMQNLHHYSDANLPKSSSFTTNSTAYVVYTSGTSGKPKGVQIAHTGAVNFACYLGQKFQINRDSKVLQLASIGFDAFTLEWMWALINGGALCISSEDDKFDPMKMASYLQHQEITHALITPAYLQHLPFHQDYHFQALMVGGEACDATLANQWAQCYPMYNAYGPSEASICCTVSKLKPDTAISIGKPIDNVQVYVLDCEKQLLPTGAIGELYIAGVGVGKGYINQSKLTASRFVINPFSDNDGNLLYRTGDLARYTTNGQLEYLGRIDEQVKIRGYRVELAEIEQQLTQSALIRQAAVTCCGEGSHKFLVAYVSLELSEMSADDIPSTLSAFL
ncbi:amino acid adenylation domain-containing protein, partial [Pseudoalteromonas sp. MMG012]|uniref:non-ribosomal peptide synthetase n=1 Tax=Pseudoalteromonas sp. MMG012 TaxID=2822686 RepID=UPI001B39F48E